MMIILVFIQTVTFVLIILLLILTNLFYIYETTDNLSGSVTF